MIAALKYTNTTNLGDDIQTLAASSWLPKIDTYLDRDFLREELNENNKISKLILNGWFTHNPEGFYPLTSDVKPLLISMHFADKSAFGTNGHNLLFKDGRLKSWLIEHGPVGCRDTSTQDLLLSNGVPAYFSGCLTTTLKISLDVVRNQDLVCAVDVSLPEFFKQKFNIKYLTHRVPNTLSDTSRRELAKDFLSLYQSSRLVITSRFHVALPCLAYGTPVIFIPYRQDDPRFTGWEPILRKVNRNQILEATTLEELIALGNTDRSKLNIMIDALTSKITNYISGGVNEKCTRFNML